MTEPERRSWWAQGAAPLVLGAFALRLYRLEFHSLWSDEGISLIRSSQPLAQLLATMPVEQLPGYFVLLHFWLALAGDADFALRFFSLWPSVLAVAVIYRLGVDLGDRRAGLAAALLLAINPLQIWYAQEGRTYSWLLASSLLVTWFLWRLLGATDRRDRVGWAAGYVLAMTLTVYLHFYGFLVPLAHTLFVLGWWAWRRDSQTLGWWIASGVLTLLFFLPWLPRTLGILSFTGWREPIDPWQIPWRYLTAYTVGEAMPTPWRVGLSWLYLALAGFGGVAWWRLRPTASLFLLSQVLIPWLAVFLLALRQPDAHERYTIFVAGPLLLVVGGGLAWPLRKESIPWLAVRRVAAVAITLLLAGMALAGGVSLARQYSEPAFQKPDFRTTAYAIQDWEQPGDIILVDGPNPQLVFLHYYRGAAPVHDLRFLSDAEFATIDATLSELTAGARRVWEVLYFHEPGPIQFWLATHGWTAPPTEYNGIRVTLYGMGAPAGSAPPFNIAFGQALTLVQATISPTAQAGDLVQVTTTWQVQVTPPDYKFSLRLTGAEGQPIQAQDYAPQNWFSPTNSWLPGSTMRDQRAFLLPRDLPSGEYAIRLRLYDPASGAAVETSAGQDVVLGGFTVVASSPARP
jgi:mannosyltransferase